MTHQPAPFVWGDISLTQAVFLDGIPHATRLAIGEWLEYSHPKQAIANIIERNPYIEDYATVLNLRTVDNANREISVYHPIGFLLIVMESGQPKAQAMKQAIAAFVWHFAGPQLISHKERVQLRNQRINILAKLDKASSAFVCRELVDDLRSVSLALGQAVGDPSSLPGLSQQALPGV